MSEMKFELQKNRLDYITSVSDELKKVWKTTRLQEVITKLDLVQSHWDKFDKTHERLANAKSDAILAHEYYQKSWYAHCLAAYSDALSDLRSVKDDIKKSLTPQGSAFMDNSLYSVSYSSRSFLPKITLKNFSGEYTD